MFLITALAFQTLFKPCHGISGEVAIVTTSEPMMRMRMRIMVGDASEFSKKKKMMMMMMMTMVRNDEEC